MTIKVIIFGGAGFIGKHFREYYEAVFSKEEILSLDINPDAESHYCDVRERIILEEFAFDEDVLILNLAAIHKTPGHPDFDYFNTNIKGARKVCNFAESLGAKRIIFTSSIAPYGASEELKTEERLPQPNTPYGISKLVAEEIHKGWCNGSGDRKLLILRPGVVFGKGENGNFTRLAAMIRKGRFLYPGRKDTIKASIYVKELVYQSDNLFKSQKEPMNTLNFAYYPALTIEEIANKLADTTSYPQPKIVVPASLLMFVAKILGALGFEKIGIHPDRVKKLMTSTNIDGQKLFLAASKKYKYDFEEALEDWYKDCNSGDLV